MTTMRIVFMGSPAFAVPALQGLVAAGHEVAGVFTQPPKPAGRGLKLTPCPVHKTAEDLELAVYTPKRLKGEALDTLKALAPDLICVAAYGLLLPQAVLDMAPCLNIHPSDLPRWRGAAPLHHTVISGDKHTAVCIMAMEKTLDTGPVYLRVPYPLKTDETTGSLHDVMAELGTAALLEVVSHWRSYKDHPTPQHEHGITYAHKLTAADTAINFNQPADMVAANIRGLAPWPGMQAVCEGVRYKLLFATPTPTIATGTAPGTITHADSKHGLVVACARGAVRISRLQREGKKPLADVELLNGNTLQVGQVLHAPA